MMLAISCPSCPHLIALDPSDRPPPWCPRCGADIKAPTAPLAPTEAAVAVARKRWNEPAAPTTAVATAPAATDALQVETPPVRVPEPPRPTTLLPEPVAEPPAAPPVPPWAMLFAVACGIIPLLTLGGGIPTALGAGGASGCIAVGRNPQMDVGTRVSLCVAITVGCWLGLFLVVGALMTLPW